MAKHDASRPLAERATFKIKIDSCFAGRFVPDLKGASNLEFLEVSSAADETSFFHLGGANVRRGGRMVHVKNDTDNPHKVTEFMNRDLHGLETWATSPQAHDEPTLASGLAASFLIGTRFTLPLRRMAAVAARVDAGDLHPRIHDVGRRRDEVRVLAESFNHMLDRLADAFAGQRAFVADASHELRTPLTVIRGQLELLASRQADLPAAEVQRVERLVTAEIARITRLVDDLLLLAKAEQTEFLRPEPIELRGYVRELWDGITLLAPRRFELGEVPEGTLTADPDRLAQALRNLVSNAIEHTSSPVGLVRLDVLLQAPDGVRFLVSDDGPGIPAAERERVFDRFHRTDAARDRASGGTGLGLAIVRAIAEAHGGRVAAGAAPEGGARIELELPSFVPSNPCFSASDRGLYPLAARHARH